MEDNMNQDNINVDVDNEMLSEDTSEGGKEALTKEEIEFVETLAEYEQSRKNLGLIIALTAINIALTVFHSFWGFAFSAFAPNLLVGLGMASDGHGGLWYGMAGGIMVLFGMCWMFCMIRPWWMVLALLLFILDTVALGVVVGFEFDPDSGKAIKAILISVVFHIWALCTLFKGTFTGFKLRRLLRKVQVGREQIIEPTIT